MLDVRRKNEIIICRDFATKPSLANNPFIKTYAVHFSWILKYCYVFAGQNSQAARFREIVMG